MNQPDHTLNRISLIGIGGGLALIAALYYPLYLLLPSQYLADWQTGSPLLAVILLLLSPLLAVGTGYLAARQANGRTRASNLIKGALAGGIAGAIFFYGLGGAAAGVVGNHAILAHGLIPAESESHFLWLLSESITGTIFWAYSTFWVTVLTGMALGAIGGYLYLKPEAKGLDWTKFHQAALSISQAAVLGSILSLVVMTAIFTVLGSQVEEVAAEFQADGFFLSFSPWWVSFWTLATPQALYLLSFSAFYLLIRITMKSQDTAQLIYARISAYIGAFGAALLPLTLILMIGSGTSFTIGMVGLTINLILAILLLRSANASASRLPARLLPTRPKWATWLQQSLIPTVVLTFILSLVGIQPIAWLLLLVVVTAFAILWRRSLSLDVMADDSIYSLPRIYESALASMLAISLPLLVMVPSTLGLVLIAVPAIAPLTYPVSTEPPASPIDFTLADHVHYLYMAHGITLLIAFLLSAILVGVSILTVKLFEVRRQRRA